MKASTLERWLLRALLIVTVFLLISGLLAPLLTVKKAILFRNTFSIVSSIHSLVISGQWFLPAVLFLFSVAFPLIKLLIMGVVLFSPGKAPANVRRYLHWIHLLGKWSMLDVFVVAVLVVAFKLGALASVQMRYGLVLFAIAVILSLFLTQRLQHLLREE